MARTRLEWIDAARGAALCLVVLLHSCIVLRAVDFPVSTRLVPINAVLDGFRMPTLLMISGLLAAGVGRWTWREVWRRRSGPLLLLYVVWGVIIAVSLGLLGSDGLFDAHGDSIALLPVRPYVRVWYFLALAMFILLARALRRVPTSVVVPAAIVVSLATYVCWPQQALPGHLEWWLYLSQHWVYFVCAERGAELYGAITRRTTPVIAAAVATSFVTVGTALWMVGLLHPVGSGRSAVPALLVAALGTATALTMFPLIGASRWLGWARAVGRRSLGIYAMHYVAAAALASLVGTRLSDAGVPGLGIALPIAVAATSTAGALLVTRALEHRAPVPFLRPWWDMRSPEAIGEAAAPARAQ